MEFKVKLCECNFIKLFILFSKSYTKIFFILLTDVTHDAYKGSLERKK
jgi:hypothetical protein